MSNSENEIQENKDNQEQIEKSEQTNNQDNENINVNIKDNPENKDNQENHDPVDVKHNQENEDIQINEDVQENKVEENATNKQEEQNNNDIQDIQDNKDNQNGKDIQENSTEKEKENNINNENKDNSEELSSPQDNKDNNNNLELSENKEKNIEQSPSQPSENQVYFPSHRNPKSKNKKRVNSMDNYLDNSISASIFVNQSSYKEPEHKPKLCFKPEKVYLQELKLKKYQFDIYRAQFVKLEHDTKIKQREYLKEQKKKIQTPLNIPFKLKQSEVKMLNFLHRSKSPYSNKWTDFMLMKNYNSQMKILGFLNGVPKYEIVKLDDKHNRNKANNNLYQQQTSLNNNNNNKSQKVSSMRSADKIRV